MTSEKWKKGMIYAVCQSYVLHRKIAGGLNTKGQLIVGRVLQVL